METKSISKQVFNRKKRKKDNKKILQNLKEFSKNQRLKMNVIEKYRQMGITPISSNKHRVKRISTENNISITMRVPEKNKTNKKKIYVEEILGQFFKS